MLDVFNNQESQANEHPHIIIERDISVEKLLHSIQVLIHESKTQKEEIDNLQGTMNRMTHSSSWRLTKPLRKLSKSIKKRSRKISSIFKQSKDNNTINEDIISEHNNISENIYEYNNNRLTITSFVPFDFTPANFGGGIRIMNVYNALSEHFNINLVAIGGLGGNVQRIQKNKYFTIYRIPMNNEFHQLMVQEEKKAGGHLHDILLTDNYTSLSDLCEFTKTIRNDTNIFISSHPYFFKMLNKYAEKKFKVYEAHNVDYILKKSYFPDGTTNKSAIEYIEKVKEIEAIACRDANLVLAVAEYDKEQLIQIYNVDPNKIIIVPNGVDHHFFEKKINYTKKTWKKKVLFVGSAHPPNIEAVDFIVNELAPMDNSIDYFIIGNLKSHFTKNKTVKKNVHFLGMVNEITKQEIYDKVDVAINPMFSGSGTNIKVLEYAAAGIPVLSTTFGMRGLDELKASVFLADKNDFFEALLNFFSLKQSIIKKNIESARRECKLFFSGDAIVRKFITHIFAIENQLRSIQKKKKFIAIEGRVLQRNMSGTERYIFEILQNVAKYSSDEYSCCVINNAIKPNVIKLSDELSSLSSLSGNKSIDLYHRTHQFNNKSELAELLFAKYMIFTFHDLILCRYPEYHNNEVSHENYVQCMGIALKLSDRIIAISEHAKKDIMDMYHIHEEKIDVIYHGIDADKFSRVENELVIKNFKEKYQLPEKYILYIGTDYPHKNLKNLYLAFNKLLHYDGMDDLYLVVAGNSYYHDKHYLDTSIDPIKNKVINIGYLEDKDISTLYSTSKVFVFPSLYEGFGFPVLEAFACGVPVVCSRSTSLPEVAGNAALMVNAENAQEICESIYTILLDKKLRDELITRGYKRVQEFTWKKCTEKTFLTYKKTLESPPLFEKDEKKLLFFIEQIEGMTHV